MKKKNFIWVLAVLLCLNLNAQKSVIILYDVSGNVKSDPYKITKDMRIEAQALAKDVITANVKKNYSGWEYLPGNNSAVINDIVSGKSKQALLDNNGYLMIMPFGNHETYKKKQIQKISNYPSDFSNHYKFPFKHDEHSTYGNIAKAVAAVTAKENAIKSYIQITIIGKGEDTQSGSYTSEEMEALDFYKTKAKITPLGLFRNTVKGVDYTIHFSSIEIDEKTPPPPPPPHKHILRVLQPDKSTKSQPVEYDSGDDVFIKWSCIQNDSPCPETTKWVLEVRQLDGEYKKNIQSGKLKHAKLNLDDGEYKITIKDGTRKLEDVYVKIGGSCLLCILIPMIILGALVFYLPKYLPKKKPAALTDSDEIPLNQPEINDDNNTQGMI